jgi:hypothetical protein
VAERRLLQEFKGIGETGAAIFCREVQSAWPELYPFADAKALDAAKKLGLGDDAKALARLVDKRDFPRLVAALIRTSLAKDYDAIIEQGCGRKRRRRGEADSAAVLAAGDEAAQEVNGGKH